MNRPNRPETLDGNEIVADGVVVRRAGEALHLEGVHHHVA
jgi:hypothetical protein